MADRPSRLKNATVVLTGATSGIGHATALALAPMVGRLILHGPEPEDRISGRLAPVRAAMGEGVELHYFKADYSRLAEVIQLARDIRGAATRIDILVNNAGRPGPPARTLTGDGNEVVLQTNYLAPVLLTSELAAAIAGRVVNIASATHLSATLQLDDLNLERHRYSAADAYARSKLALVAWSCWLAANPPHPGLEVVSMHPGVIATPLLHAMFSVRGDRPERAAEAIVDVAALSGDKGAYYNETAPVSPNPLAVDPAVQNRLHDATLRILGRSPAPR